MQLPCVSFLDSVGHSQEDVLLPAIAQLPKNFLSVYNYSDDNYYRVIWQAYSDVKVEFTTRVKVYADEPMVLFSIEYTDGLTNASIPDTNDQTLSSFPSFIMEENDVKRASLTWSGSSKWNINIKSKI